jgi:hypothetical protein
MASELLDEDFFTSLPFHTGLASIFTLAPSDHEPKGTGIPIRSRPETRGRVNTCLPKDICETVTEAVPTQHTANEEDYA